MERESISNKSVAIVGAGPAGCFCAKFLQDAGFEVFLFDKGKFLRTILPTGGGRCNISYAEYDFKQLAKNYPRGEKFLYSIFSKFGVSDTVLTFKNLGLETYIQADNRIFPASDSSKDVRQKLLNSLNKTKFINEEVLDVVRLDGNYKITTEKSKYLFDFVVVAIGGHVGFDLLKNFNFTIQTPVPALVALNTSESFSKLAGVVLKNVIYRPDKKTCLAGDILFTHKGVSGPLIYKISSLYARNFLPYSLPLELVANIPLQELLNKNPHKEIKNLLSEFVPKSFALHLLKSLNFDENTPCHKINGKQRDSILKRLTCYELTITGKVPDSEVVTCGGIDLGEVNPNTLESKKYSGLYFCGEVLDIDGFCGGFNLQNCWSSGYVAAQGIINRQ